MTINTLLWCWLQRRSSGVTFQLVPGEEQCGGHGWTSSRQRYSIANHASKHGMLESIAMRHSTTLARLFNCAGDEEQKRVRWLSVIRYFSGLAPRQNALLLTQRYTPGCDWRRSQGLNHRTTDLRSLNVTTGLVLFVVGVNCDSERVKIVSLLCHRHKLTNKSHFWGRNKNIKREALLVPIIGLLILSYHMAISFLTGLSGRYAPSWRWPTLLVVSTEKGRLLKTNLRKAKTGQ